MEPSDIRISPQNTSYNPPLIYLHRYPILNRVGLMRGISVSYSPPLAILYGNLVKNITQSIPYHIGTECPYTLFLSCSSEEKTVGLVAHMISLNHR